MKTIFLRLTEAEADRVRQALAACARTAGSGTRLYRVYHQIIENLKDAQDAAVDDEPPKVITPTADQLANWKGH